MQGRALAAAAQQGNTATPGRSLAVAAHPGYRLTAAATSPVKRLTRGNIGSLANYKGPDTLMTYKNNKPSNAEGCER